MIGFSQKGDYKQTETFLTNLKAANYRHILERYGQIGVDALAAATPKDTGLTAGSWYFKVSQSKRDQKYRLTWCNSHVVDGQVVAILLQYGHGTRSGTYIEGKDFVNPAIRSTFDGIAESIWREVRAL